MVRKYRRKPGRVNPDRRMARAAELRAEGLSLRQIARELNVTTGTIARDLMKNITDLPGAGAGDGGYVYVLRYGDGAVKVGRTRGAGGRLKGHQTTGRVFGRQMVDWWVSPPHDDWKANEKALIGIAAEMGTPIAAEYFPGIDFAALVDRAKTLPFPPPDPAAANAASRQEPAQLQEFVKNYKIQMAWGGFTEDEAAEELADWVATTAPGFARLLLERAMHELITADEPEPQAALW